MPISPVFIRQYESRSDQSGMQAFLNPVDSVRLEQIQGAIDAGDGFILVAESEGQVAGWAVVHTRYRRDIGWTEDEDTVRFQSGENAYLEYVEVEEARRGRGIGHRLLAWAEEAARQQGKRVLWLHAAEENAKAQRFYCREGWAHHATVHPAWRNGAAMCVYRKQIAMEIAKKAPGDLAIDPASI